MIPVTKIGLGLFVVWTLLWFLVIDRKRTLRPGQLPPSENAGCLAWFIFSMALVAAARAGMFIGVRLGPTQCRYVDVEAASPCAALSLLGMLAGIAVVSALIYLVYIRPRAR